MRSFKAGNLNVQIFETRALMGEAAARAAMIAMCDVMKNRDIINVVFAAAPSQSDMLVVLKKSGFPFEKVRAFHMDEYIGLPSDAPQRFSNFLARELWDGLPFHEIHRIEGNAPDAEAECLRYEALLNQYPPDVVLCGIGENGHLAFNDPPVANFRDEHLAKIVELDEICRNQQVRDGCFASIQDVPTHAITLTLPLFINAPRVIVVVPAASKADAVYRTVNEERSTACPSTLLRDHPNATMFLDISSAAKLLK